MLIHHDIVQPQDECCVLLDRVWIESRNIWPKASVEFNIEQLFSWNTGRPPTSIWPPLRGLKGDQRTCRDTSWRFTRPYGSAFSAPIWTFESVQPAADLSPSLQRMWHCGQTAEVLDENLLNRRFAGEHVLWREYCRKRSCADRPDAETRTDLLKKSPQICSTRGVCFFQTRPHKVLSDSDDVHRLVRKNFRMMEQKGIFIVSSEGLNSSCRPGLINIAEIWRIFQMDCRVPDAFKKEHSRVSTSQIVTNLNCESVKASLLR